MLEHRREDGDVLSGEAFVIPESEDHLLEHLDEATRLAAEQDWRLHDINIVPVRK